MRAVVISTMVLAAVPASAETVSPTPHPALVGAKSESTAMGLAAGGAIVTTGLIIASVAVNLEDGEPNKPLLYAGIGTSLFTPSLGQWYAGQYLTIGMGIRGVAGALAIVGFSQKQDQPCADRPGENCPGITGIGLTLISLAAIAYIGGIAYDVRDAGPSVARYNKKLAAKRTATLAPTRNGVALVGQF